MIQDLGLRLRMIPGEGAAGPAAGNHHHLIIMTKAAAAAAAAAAYKQLSLSLSLLQLLNYSASGLKFRIGSCCSLDQVACARAFEPELDESDAVSNCYNRRKRPKFKCATPPNIDRHRYPADRESDPDLMQSARTNAQIRSLTGVRYTVRMHARRRLLLLRVHLRRETTSKGDVQLVSRLAKAMLA